MREYSFSVEGANSPDQKSSQGRSILERVLGDAVPIVPSTNGEKYDINSRPTELSSGGYVDITD